MPAINPIKTSNHACTEQGPRRPAGDVSSDIVRSLGVRLPSL
jgi:hypothetical protein